MAHNNLGLVLQYVRKDYDGAERHYRKAIDLDGAQQPRPRVAVRAQGLRRCRASLPEGNRSRWRTTTSASCCSTCARTTTVQSVITGRQSISTAHNNLGLVLQYVRKDYDGAERHYRKAIDLDPTKAAAHNISSSRRHRRHRRVHPPRR